jgi:hypothetical protein
MEEIREIGIEKEVFLLDKNRQIMEPKLYGFPHDEFCFLVELRSVPSDRFEPAYLSLHQEELRYKLRANKFGMELRDIPTVIKSKDWVDKHWNKYNLHKFDDSDNTQNIYNPYHKKQSHHLGVLDTENPDIKTLTAGMHVHFSSRDSETGEVIGLPIENIVEKMDKHFYYEIKNVDRNPGEWEPKAHGFEYRSLPCNIDVYKVLKESFRILREI